MEFLFELNMRKEIPYLQATMYYFVYHMKHNSPLLRRKAHFINEWK